MNAEYLISLFQKHGCDFFVGVPDSLLKDLSFSLQDISKHIIAANEGNAIGIAIGYYLSTRKVPIVYMQNSGLGNSINPLVSLADNLVYGIPMIVIVGWRGYPDTKDEPQHKKQGLITDKLLSTLNYDYKILSSNEIEIESQVETLINKSINDQQPVFLLVKDSLADLDIEYHSYKNLMSRKEALHKILNKIPDDSLVISTTGKLSREIFEYRKINNKNHDDFLVVGGMGHCSQIALGVALNTNKKVYCLDGDGSILMHMGGLATIGKHKPDNLTHIVFNNGCHESVGGQQTCNNQIVFSNIAKNCGYTKTYTTTTIDSINFTNKELTFVEILVNTKKDKNLCRPNIDNVTIKNNFIRKIKNESNNY
jgi:phosphonopyruvate decarboxylase